MNKYIKEDAIGMLIVTVCFSILVLGLLIIWAPASHYLEKWNKWWDEEEEITTVEMPTYQNVPIYFEPTDLGRRLKAKLDCLEHVTGDDTTYDCYGIEFEKLNTTNK